MNCGHGMREWPKLCTATRVCCLCIWRNVVGEYKYSWYICNLDLTFSSNPKKVTWKEQKSQLWVILDQKYKSNQ